MYVTALRTSPSPSLFRTREFVRKQTGFFPFKTAELPQATNTPHVVLANIYCLEIINKAGAGRAIQVHVNAELMSENLIGNRYRRPFVGR